MSPTGGNCRSRPRSCGFRLSCDTVRENAIDELADRMPSGHRIALCERQQVQGWGPWSVGGGIHYAHAPASVLAQVLALRVHFDDSNRENGPLRILPGTHHYGVLSDDEIEEFSTRVAPVECAVPKRGSGGDASLVDSFIVQVAE